MAYKKKKREREEDRKRANLAEIRSSGSLIVPLTIGWQRRRMSVPSNNACNVGVHAHACDSARHARARAYASCTATCTYTGKRRNVLVNASHAAVVAVSPYVGDIFIMSRTNRPSCRIMPQTNADDVMKPANATRETPNHVRININPYLRLFVLSRSVLHKR